MKAIGRNISGFQLLAYALVVVVALLLFRSVNDARDEARSQAAALALQIQEMGGVPVVGPEAGKPGVAGRDGLSGRDGIDGRDGTDGRDGFIGPVGPSGPPGATGARGTVGPAGTDGVDGAPGPAGADGTAGVDGAPGPAGPVGPQGEEPFEMQCQRVAGDKGEPQTFTCRNTDP